MKCDLEEREGVSKLVVSGNITLGVCEQLGESVDTLLASGRDKILLDLSDVDYMDSAGIGELVASHRTVMRFGGALKILKPSRKVQDSLGVTQLLPVFEVFTDEGTAIASFNA